MRNFPNYDTCYSRPRHRQTFLGWSTRFVVDGERWTWKLRPSCKYREDAEAVILKRFPTATNIEVVKIMSEE